MTTKSTNSVLDLVDPPIDNMVLLAGILDDVVIGSHVPNVAYFTNVTDTALASPLVGAPATLLSQVFLGFGLAMEVIGGQNYLFVDLPAGPPPSRRSNGVL